MPPDGGSVPARKYRGRSRGNARGKGRVSRSTRFRPWMLVAHAITLVAHVVPTVALMVVLTPLSAVVAGASAFVFTTLRLTNLIRESKKNRWITRLVDEPVLAHWCASILSTLLFVIVAPL